MEVCGLTSGGKPVQFFGRFSKSVKELFFWSRVFSRTDEVRRLGFFSGLRMKIDFFGCYLNRKFKPKGGGFLGGGIQQIL